MAGDAALFESSIGRIAGSLSEMLQEPDGTDALETLLRYLAATHPKISGPRIRALVEQLSGQGRSSCRFLDGIENRGRNKGLHGGCEEGLKQARRAYSHTLLTLLVRHFGPVPEEVRQRVRDAGDRGCAAGC